MQINEYVLDTDKLNAYSFCLNEEWLDFVIHNKTTLDSTQKAVSPDTSQLRRQSIQSPKQPSSIVERIAQKKAEIAQRESQKQSQKSINLVNVICKKKNI